MFDLEELMRLAIDEARQGIARGQSPFGCAIASGDRLLSVAHNTVLADGDVTAHAEVNALRRACAATGEIAFPDAVVATTCEPCPMCLGALHWARVGRVIYGATIADAAAAGFHELQVPAAAILQLAGESRPRLTAEFLRPDCRQLMAEWRCTPGARAY